MIKGISKQIIEIKCPNNEYFEKALLFVNSSANLYDAEMLNDKAKAFANSLTGEVTSSALGKKEKSPNKNKFVIAAFLSSALVGIIIMAAVL